MAAQHTLSPFTRYGYKPKGVREARIVSNGYFCRVLLGGSYCFKYQQHYINPPPPVEVVSPHVRRHKNDNTNYALFPWRLNLKSFLWLEAIPGLIPSALPDLRVYLFDILHNKYDRREYGTHLFVSNDNVLRYFVVFQQNSKAIPTTSDIAPINDIVPKVRVFPTAGQTIIKAIIYAPNRDIQIHDNEYARWWLRTGRERETRVVEFGDHVMTHFRDYIPLRQPFYGVYVHDRAKLIIGEPIGEWKRDQRQREHTRTLVLGGVFVLISSHQLFFRFNHNHEIECNFTRFIEIYNEWNPYSNVHFTSYENLVFMLHPIPSIGESLCWFIALRDPNGVLNSSLDIPSFGLNRISLYDSITGLWLVENEQREHHYHQNIQIPGRTQPIPPTNTRVTQLTADEVMNFERIVN